MDPERVDASVVVRARKTRLADAVVITSRAQLTEAIVTEPTRFLYNPEVIFLANPVELVRGREYRVRIAYPYGGDTLDAEIAVEPA